MLFYSNAKRKRDLITPLKTSRSNGIGVNTKGGEGRFFEKLVIREARFDDSRHF